MRVLNPLSAGMAIALAGLLGGCSLSLDFDCSEDGDCANLDGVFACIDGACVDGRTQCSADGDCAGLAGENICGDDGFCVEGTRSCPSVIEPRLCSDILGPPGADVAARAAAFEADRGAWTLVAMHPPHGGFAGEAKASIVTTAALAVTNINESGGFEQADGTALAVLICDDGVEAQGRGVEAAMHAADCGAVALIGTHETAPTLEIYQDAARPLGLPLISPGAISPAVPNVRTNTGAVQNDDLLWRIKVPGDVVARVTGEFVRTLGDMGQGHERVRILHRAREAYGELMSDALFEALCPRAGDSTFCDDDQRVQISTYDNQVAQDVQEALEANPNTDLVITLTSNFDDLLQVVTGIGLSGVEADFITLEGARSDLASLAVISGQTDNDRAAAMLCRTIGISSGITGPAYQTWQSALALEMVDLPPFAPPAAYVDALYVTAFAIASAAANGAVDTPNIINGLRLLSDAASPEVQVNNWAEGVSRLTNRQPINYSGASGAIDFDNETNDVTDQNVEIWRYRLSGQGDTLMGSLFTGQGNVRLTDAEGGLLLDVRDRLVRQGEPACDAHPYVALLPNPGDAPQE